MEQFLKTIFGIFNKNKQIDILKIEEIKQNTLKPISKDDLLMGRDKQYPNEYTKEVSDNLDKLLIIMNKVQELYGKQLKINSGWRPLAINSAISNAAKKSNHLLGLAVDIEDSDGNVMNWVLQNLQTMKDLGLYFEDWNWTPTWTHFQIVPPKSGNRIFIPSSGLPLKPNRWSGTYPSKYN